MSQVEQSDQQNNEQLLDSLRAEIDDINTQLITLFSKRGDLANAIGLIKTELGRPNLHDPEREEQQLRRLVQLNPGPFPDEVIETIFRQIFKACLELEETKK